MKIDFIPIDYDYFDWKGKNYAKIYGRDSQGKRICVIDSCPVYLWAILKEDISEKKIKKLKKEIESIQLDLKGRKTKVEKVEIHKKNYLEKPVKALKIFATNYKDLHDVADRLDYKEIEKRRGYDLGFTTHYIIEKKVNPLNWYEIQGEVLHNSEKFGGVDMSMNVDMCIKAESIKQTQEKSLSPKVLAFDIETDEIKIGEGEILMVSLVSKDFKKVLTWKKPENKNSVPEYVEIVKDEEELIEKFTEYVKDISPDFLTGYFSDGFDLPYLKARADKHKIKLPLGIDESQPRFSKGRGLSSGKIKGIVHVDLLRFIKTTYSQYMKSETLSLDEVSKEFLGNKKKEFEIKHSSKLNDMDWENYYAYNLQDSILTHDLFQNFWPDLLEFARILKAPVFEVSRNGMSSNVESYIIHNLERFNEIPEKRPGYNEIGERRAKGKYEGAFVFEPTPGLYEDIVMYDFTSSYGSVIVSYNLSKPTLLEKKKKNSYEIKLEGKKVYFKKEQGFIPQILEEIIEKRKKYKKELTKNLEDNTKRARSNAFKLLANSYYGYQGFFGARYYCREAAAATAAFAKKSIKDAIKKIEKNNHKVIYSDTDSIAFLKQNKTEKQIKELFKKINSSLPGIMELELEGFFKRGIWVSKRTTKTGAKKKYALIDKKDNIKIRGFETVRRDWCQLSREVQNKIIELILKNGNEKKALKYLKETIKKIKQRKINTKELIIKTQLKKPISEYKTISPHVVAAKKMKQKEIPVKQGGVIEYYIAESKENKKLVRERVKLPSESGEYDIEYYLNHQIIPAVENIFDVFNINLKEIIQGKKQTTLGDF